MSEKRQPTATTAFGVGRRESHDSSAFYARFRPPDVSEDDTIGDAPDLSDGCILGDARNMHQLPDASVALVVTSPPYFVGKEYELAVAGNGSPGIPTSYLEYLDMLTDVFAECVRVLEPGGRIAVNVANLGRKPYRSLSADVIRILQDDLGLLLRGEVVWQKAEGATGSVAWGSFRKAANPVLRDMTERVVIASKGRFDRARAPKKREEEGLPHESTVTTDEFMEATLDLWRIDSEQAGRVGHPAPFPVELPRRLIDLYTYRDDLVLDPFLGSGSTLVAALRAGRRGVGYDLEADYIDLARERLATEKDRLKAGAVAEWRRSDLAGSTGPQDGLFPGLDGHDDTEHLLERAAESGKKAADIAEGVLVEAGFDIVKAGVVRRDLGAHFAFLVTDQAVGRQWYIEVSGAFTTARPGMRRTDALWKTLGRAHVLASGHDGDAPEDRPRLLVLTPRLPRHGSEGDRAMRAVGGSGFFDAVEMFDDAAVQRLRHYAENAPDRPLPGFWDEEEISHRFA
ncbi:MAG: site-specific DNA-methyltransferase [Acidimicrobiia bacterium]|nr:site-specific DNA-methyltransferase [Actinomycetota bacterium]MBL6924875.1 site-specific DNA-methyltransferase [Acidimicrobiia bacterium]MBL6927217.1 site-specific DNA-methyltransferase [Acidimicrobiia bacterium]